MPIQANTKITNRYVSSKENRKKDPDNEELQESIFYQIALIPVNIYRYFQDISYIHTRCNNN